MQSQRKAVDAHAHVFHRGLKMVDGRRYTPTGDAPVDLYLRRLDENGLTHGVLVQPSFLGTDNSHMIESIARAGGRLRGIAVVEPRVSADEVDRLDGEGVVGARLNLAGGAALPDLADARWRGFIDIIARKKWQIEVQRKARDLLVLAPRLLDAGVDLVLDHFALPDPARGAEDPAWLQLLDLGATGRLWVKMSGTYRNGPNGREMATACYRVLREKLGVDRLMWGSDWPHTQFEATECFASARVFLDELVPDARERAAILAAPFALFRFPAEAAPSMSDSGGPRGAS